MKCLELRVEEFTVYIYASDFDSLVAVTEAKHRGVPLRGPYAVQDHPAHTSPGEDHVHVYYKNNQIFALNKKSGTAHDQSHGITIPNKVAKALKQMFPGINIPPNNFIESAPLTDQLALTLAEAGEL
jgi:23S rRNA-/tRNA-specific pseudouridylate synthase